ncbi:gephyrin-like molybdotransferase receptor GlpR [Actinomycetospora sp. OC33-EN08]|uniref:Gephyrin-like molybdotransferase receptor GlpR n=1 Tax=Actinomycetospora aurantiaca TaxID=3129233 RepID=A0ABU8MXG5_9PSEU
MPSSLVFAALVVAWLAVLVPVVARRRQMVPRPADADLSARVLTRPERTSGAGAGGATGDEEVTMTSTTDEVVPGAAEDVEDVEVAPEGRVLDRARRAPDATDDEYDDEYDDGYDDRDDDGYDDELADAEPEPGHRPRTYRPGRGGFDAEAAEAAAHARYAFRQRVALGLIAVAVLAALAAIVVSPSLWWLFAATVVGLGGYLVFLRRQTRIEDELRRRRAARLSGERRAIEARRERQAEHEERLAAVQAWGRYESGEHEVPDLPEARRGDEDDDLDDAPDVPEPRWIAPRTPAPAVPEGTELVGDTEDDPAFCDLADLEDARRVHAYRRGA